MTRETDNPMTGCDFDWMVSNHAVWGWKVLVKASVSGVSLLQLSPFFASIFPLFPPETPDTQAREILKPCSLQEVKWWLSWPLLLILNSRAANRNVKIS